MTFTFEQIDALATGLAFVEAAGDPALAEAAQAVRAKLQASLPDPDRRALSAAPFFAARRDGRAAHASAIVRRAIRGSAVLLIRYADASGTATERRVRPLAIWAFTDGWLFAGWCELRHDFRAFRMDRILSVAATDDRFADDPDRNLCAFVETRMIDLPPR